MPHEISIATRDMDNARILGTAHLTTNSNRKIAVGIRIQMPSAGFGVVATCIWLVSCTREPTDSDRNQTLARCAHEQFLSHNGLSSTQWTIPRCQSTSVFPLFFFLALGMPSRNDGPPSVWDTHGMSGNVFANPTAQESTYGVLCVRTHITTRDE